MREVVPETVRARTLVLDVDAWSGHRAGQHVDVRLTAEDGYQAERTYSIASAPEDDVLEITVDRVDDGEVSPYLVDELRPGDVFEIRGPIGGHFTWSADEGRSAAADRRRRGARADHVDAATPRRTRGCSAGACARLGPVGRRRAL